MLLDYMVHWWDEYSISCYCWNVVTWLLDSFNGSYNILLLLLCKPVASEASELKQKAVLIKTPNKMVLIDCESQNVPSSYVEWYSQRDGEPLKRVAIIATKDLRTPEMQKKNTNWMTEPGFLKSLKLIGHKMGSPKNIHPFQTNVYFFVLKLLLYLHSYLSHDYNNVLSHLSQRNLLLPRLPLHHPVHLRIIHTSLLPSTSLKVRHIYNTFVNCY